MGSHRSRKSHNTGHHGKPAQQVRSRPLSDREVRSRNRSIRIAREYASQLHIVSHVSYRELRRQAREYVIDGIGLDPDDPRQVSAEQFEDWLLRTARHRHTNYEQLLTPINAKPGTPSTTTSSGVKPTVSPPAHGRN